MTLRVCAISTVGILSALLLAAGIALMQSEVFSTITTNRLKKAIVLVEGSLVFESWKSPPPPVYMEYFFFNVTNVNEIIEGARPEVKQVGPYTYREYRYKENVTMVGNNTKVSAYTTKSFVFLAEKSVGDPAVEYITTVNIPAWAVMEKMKHSFVKKISLSALMKSIGSTIFTTRTVDELLWGYEDPLLVKVATINSDVEKFFGLMYKKNGSNSGEFVYNTGVENYMDYGRVETWKNQRQLTFWTSNQSNSINGSDGSAFHPLLTKDERIYVFNPDLCRSIYMDFEKDLEVKGIPAYRFTPPRSVLASKEENPANEGFCVSRKECLGTGLLKVSPCRKGVQVVASFPHFHLADEKYVSSIGGMSPQSQHHQTFLDLNPTTGVILRANKRAQVNYLINRIIGFTDTRALTQTVFPIMFLNESVVIDDASAAKVQRLLLIRNLVVNLPLIIAAMGAILLAVFIILVIRACKQKNAVKRIVFTKPLYAKSTEEDTSYCPVSDKEKEDLQNGTYIGLTTTGDPQA